MLKIRPEQMEALNRRCADNTVETVFRHIAQSHPPALAGLPDGEARRRVEATVARARAHGLATIPGIGAFAALSFAVSPRFDEHPKVRAILDGSLAGLNTVPPDARMEALGTLMTDADWESVQMFGGGSPLNESVSHGSTGSR
jgi:hypothetical protein